MNTKSDAAQANTAMRDALLLIGKRGTGHIYDCSASQGSESDCTCGWAKVRKLIDKLAKEKP